MSKNSCSTNIRSYKAAFKLNKWNNFWIVNKKWEKSKSRFFTCFKTMWKVWEPLHCCWFSSVWFLRQNWEKSNLLCLQDRFMQIFWSPEPIRFSLFPSAWEGICFGLSLWLKRLWMPLAQHALHSSGCPLILDHIYCFKVSIWGKRRAERIVLLIYELQRDLRRLEDLKLRSSCSTIRSPEVLSNPMTRPGSP